MSGWGQSCDTAGSSGNPYARRATAATPSLALALAATSPQRASLLCLAFQRHDDGRLRRVARCGRDRPRPKSRRLTPEAADPPPYDEHRCVTRPDSPGRAKNPHGWAIAARRTLRIAPPHQASPGKLWCCSSQSPTTPSRPPQPPILKCYMRVRERHVQHRQHHL